MKVVKKQSGFTIVELLIVVVVIAILAAITIVAYNGIQERSRASAAAASLKQATTQIALHKTLNEDTLPATLGSIANSSINASEYEYWTFANSTQYCLSTESSNGSAYYIRSDGQPTPQEGSCDAIDWVAGEPLAYTDTPGATVNFSSPLTGTPDMTLYTIFSVNDANFGYSGFAGFNPSNPNNRFYFQGAEVGSTTAGYRIDTPITQNYTGSQGGVRVPGYHIAWLQASSNGTVRSFAYDKVTSHATFAMSPGTGWNFTSLFLSPMSSSYTPIAAVGYSAAHNEETRRQVMNWLSKKYNAGLEY